MRTGTADEVDETERLEREEATLPDIPPSRLRQVKAAPSKFQQRTAGTGRTRSYLHSSTAGHRGGHPPR